MEQAPLVYSSKQQIGVGVTAGVPESPGLDINVGYKGLDAAFVPVAVAKYCPPDKGIDCQDEIFAMKPLSGSTLEGSTSQSNKDNLARLRAQMEGLNAQITALETAISDDQRLKIANKALRDTKPTLEAQHAGLIAPPQDDAASVETNGVAATAVRAQIDAIDKLETDGQIDTRIGEREKQLKPLREQYAEAKADEEKLIRVRDSSVKDDKQDAYSVFGNFNGKAGGEEKSASIAVGKVFSTGIAAQHIAQGIKQGEAVAQRTKCLQIVADMLAKLTVAAERQALIDQSAEICGSGYPPNEAD